MNGTTDSDDFVVTEGATRTVTITTNGTILEPVTIASTVGSLALAGLSGDDTFVVNPALAGSGLPLSIDGGDPNASDTLVVNASLAADFVVVNKGRILDTGVVRVYQNAVAMPDISYKNVEIVLPNVATGADGQPQLLDMGPDLYEPNESIANAAFLGSGSTLQIQNASIFPNSNTNPPALRIRTIIASWRNRPARSTSRCISRISRPRCCRAEVSWKPRWSTAKGTFWVTRL